MQARYEGQVTFIGVAGRDSLEASQRFISDLGLEGFTHVVDAESEIWAQYEIFDQPAFALINGDGETSVFIGALGMDGLVEAAEALIAA